jgi:4-amino-4-deoxy-L-arabinose transferase-like glycosyltransferase
VLLIALAVVGWRATNIELRERWRQLSPEVAWLLFWSLGGLLVMSLIPSKRVDRIFPVVAPLCLLLAAQFRSAASDARLRRWGSIALVFACIFTSGYAAHKVFTGYRDGRGGLVEFAAAVRARSTDYEVIGGKEEGLLLYLRRTRFLKPPEAVERWNAGTLDAVVAPAEQVPQLLTALSGAVESGLSGETRINRQPRRYVLLTRAAE